MISTVLVLSATRKAKITVNQLVSDLKILKHFTQRRLRPLILLAPDEDKVRIFGEMMEAFAKDRISVAFS